MHTPSLEELLREILSVEDLDLVLSTDWASSKVGHRERIRRALLADISLRLNLDEEQKKHVLDLSITPKVTEYSVSISHCRQMGGYVRASDRTSLGFDIEVIDRVSELAAKKMRFDDSEWNEAPSASSFWVAKEAAFKSLFSISRQPVVPSQVKVGQWKRWNEMIETCQIVDVENQEVPHGRGCVWTSILDLNNSNVSMKMSIFALR